jgi:23S rRNA pseudouridine1911/1915/1917 synthase
MTKNQVPAKTQAHTSLAKKGKISTFIDSTLQKFKNIKPSSSTFSGDLKVLYEDDRIVIIDKPAGLMVHGDGRSTELTLSDIIAKQFPYMVGIGQDIELDHDGDEGLSSIQRPGIVHRLDRETTGALILCKNADSFIDMKNIFKEHKIKKIYRAIVEGNVRNDTGLIDTPIARAKSDFRKKTIVDQYAQDHRGTEREAITRYKVLARSADKKYTYVEVYPMTGRTHQIRVHLRGIRHPIIGDELYSSRAGAVAANRCMLHAYKIEFKLRGKEISVASPMPSDMQKKVDEYFGKSI